MTYLDMLSDLASGSEPVDPNSARAVLNGAENELAELKEQVQARFPEGSAEKQTTQKPRSSFTVPEKAQFYQEQRAAGNDPNAAWQALPE
jgi:cytochrome c556